MDDNMDFLNVLQESDKFDLNYIRETNVKIIGNAGTPEKPPFWEIDVWNLQWAEPNHYDVKVDQNTGFIIAGKSWPFFFFIHLAYFKNDNSVWIAMALLNALLWFFRLGSVSAFILVDDTGLDPFDPDTQDELWQLEPGTPVPIELLFTQTPGNPEVTIRPRFLNTTTPEKFRKVCLTDELNLMNVVIMFL